MSTQEYRMCSDRLYVRRVSLWFLKIHQILQLFCLIHIMEKSNSNYLPTLNTNRCIKGSKDRFFDRLVKKYPYQDGKSYQNTVYLFSRRKRTICLHRFVQNQIDKTNQDMAKLTSIVQSFENLLEIIDSGEPIQLDKIPWLSEYGNQKVFKSITNLAKKCNQRIFLAQCIEQVNPPKKSFEENLQKFVDQDSARRIIRMKKSNQLYKRIVEAKRQINSLQRKIYILEQQYQQNQRNNFSFNSHQAQRDLGQQRFLQIQIQRLNIKLKQVKRANHAFLARRQVCQERLQMKQKDIDQLKNRLHLQQKSLVAQNQEGLQVARQLSQESEYILRAWQNLENDQNQVDSFIDFQQNINNEQSPEYYPGQTESCQQGVPTSPNISYQNTCQRVEQEVVINAASAPYQDPPLVSSALENPDQIDRFQLVQETLLCNNDSQVYPKQKGLPLVQDGGRLNHPMKFKKIKKHKQVFASFVTLFKRKKRKSNIKMGTTILWRKYKSQKKRLQKCRQESQYLAWRDRLRDGYLPRQAQRAQLDQRVGRRNIQRALQQNMQVGSQEDNEEQEWQDQSK